MAMTSTYNCRPTAGSLAAKGPDPPAAAMAIATKPHAYHLITKEAIDKAPTKILQGLVRFIVHYSHLMYPFLSRKMLCTFFGYITLGNRYLGATYRFDIITNCSVQSS